MKNLLSLIIIAATLTACGGGGSKVDPVTPDPPKKDLSAPTSVRVLSLGCDFLEFGWDAVTGAASYRYNLLKGLTQDKSGDANGCSVKIEGLVPETLYTFEVKAVSGSTSSNWSTRLEATTSPAGPTPPEYPDPIGDADAVYAAMNMPPFQDDALTRAFPGAEGGGMMATGGRGGRILHVTNLNDSGEGSLRWAVGQKGARTVVFDVAGVISLNSTLKISNPDITIAGQTAPGDGICLKGHTTRVDADNVIIRHLRFRMGDVHDVEDDALNCYTSGSGSHSNIIIDHCSVSWSTDECASFYGVKDFTLQYCIISESLANSVHAKGSHGYGGLWGGQNASFHHNLLAHHTSRNPRFDHDYLNTLKGPVHYYNNVVYNWKDNSAYGGESGPGASPRQINFVNNYYKPGPATASKCKARLVNPTTKCSNCNSKDQTDVTPGKFFIEGNVMDGSSTVTADNWKGVQPDNAELLESLKSAKYFGTEPAYLQTATQAYATVLASAGASIARDRIDERIVGETEKGTFTYNGSRGSSKGIIDSQEDVGGWPAYKADEEQLSMVADTDGDGIPDYHECLFGLDRTDPSDAAAFTIDYKLRRYSNFEMYLQYLTRNTKY